MILARRRERNNTARGSQPNSTTAAELPGNDGAWFLKAVGIAAPATTLTDVGGSGESTTELVQELWHANGAATPAAPAADGFKDWVPEELSPTIGRDRNFRWSMVAVLGVVVIAIIAVGLWLPGTSEPRARQRTDDYRRVLAEMRADLPDTQSVLAVVTEPAADASQFPDLIPIVADLQADADQALEVAGLALPAAWPLASNQPFIDLEASRQQVSQQATVAESIARRLGDVLDYRTLFAGFLDTGDLPRTAGSDLNDLNTRLASASADSATVLSELPADAEFAAHTRLAESTLERFLVWQVDYVDALRTDSAEDVAALLDELAEMRQALDTALLDALAETRSQVDQDIIRLAGNIELALSEIV